MPDLTKDVEEKCIEYINSLRAMKIGDIKENTPHQIKRIDKYTWEYTCPCCNGRRISMRSNVNPKSGKQV